MLSRRTNRHLIVILIIAFLLRMVLHLVVLKIHQNYLAFHAADTPSYLQSAISLIETGQFLDVDGEPNILRTPGYSLFLIPGLLLNRVESITLFVQILLSVATVYLVYQIGAIAFDRKVATFAALLYALEPLSIVYSTMMLSETLFLALFGLLTFFLLASIQSDRYAIALLPAAGLCLSGAIFVRPVAYYLIVLIPILVAGLQVKKRRSISKNIVISILLFLLGVTPVYLWKIRNQRVAGYSGISTVTEQNLYYWHAGSIVTRKERLPFLQVLGQLEGKVDDEIAVETPKERYKRYEYMRRQGLKTIAENPRTYSNIRLNGTVSLLVNSSPLPWLKLLDMEVAPLIRTFDAFYQRGYWGLLNAYIREMPRHIYVAWIILQVVTIPYLILAAVGTVGLLKNRRLMKPALLIILSLAAYMILVSGGPEGIGSRYRHPIMPTVCLLAACGITDLMAQFEISGSRNAKL